jgi:cytochrome P450
MSTTTMDLSYQEQPDCNDLRHIPGSYGWPIVGRTPEILKDFQKVIEQSVRDYGHLSRIQLGFQKGLLVTHPDHLKEIFLDKDRNFSTKMGYAETLGRFYTGGLLMRDWEDHKVQRRLFQNSFKFDAMKGYVEIMNPVLRQGVESWKDRGNFLFFPSIKELLLDMAGQVFLGIEDFKGAEAKRVSKLFIDIAEQGLLALIKREIPGLKYYKGMQARREMINYFARLIPLRRAGNGKDTMSILVKTKDEEGNYFSDADLCNHLNFLLFAAHDTTTSALNHVMCYIARPEYQHIQEAIRQEAQSFNKEFLDYEDLEQMPVTENAFHEGLRMHPSVSLMTRRTIRECEIGGYRIPANTMLFIASQWAHRSPEYWSNPLKFDPERFSPERSEQKGHAFQFMPFGGGGHKCLGMNFAMMNGKLFLHQFLRKYRVSAVNESMPIMQVFPLPQPSDDLPLKLERIA